MIVGVGVGPAFRRKGRFWGERFRIFGSGRRQHGFEIILYFGLENGFVRRVEEVDDTRAQVVEPPGQAGMDGGKVVDANHQENANWQNPDTSKVFSHGEDYITKVGAGFKPAPTGTLRSMRR